MDPVMTVEDLNAFSAAEFPQLGGVYVVEALGPMTARVRLRVNDSHLRPGGTVSGPTIFGLVDCAVYYAILAMIGPEALTVTTNATVDFMRKPEAGRDLIADVELLKLGRVLAVGDVRVVSEGSDDVVARATLTYSRPPKRNEG